LTFEHLMASRRWKPIRDCPGRFVLSLGDRNLPPQDLAGPGIEFREHRVSAARDIVIVGRFAEGGIISYKRSDGSYVHTLNTPEGFERKLHQLGLAPPRKD
jgi:hypothetical protein